MHLGVFARGPGHHLAAWRHPDVPANPGIDFTHYADAARTAERGLFDMFFLADSLSARHAEFPIDVLERTGHVVHFEPLTLLSALSTVTTRIGLVATASTTYWEPFHLARFFASLDHLSGGRAGWNIVTSSDAAAAANFSLGQHPPHAERYERAHEFITVVKALWDSWGDDAFVADKASGIAIDRNAIRIPGHSGRHFKVRGPLNVPRAPQGYPVLIQAGSSGSGQELAARSAEVVFTAQSSLSVARDFYASLKSQVEAAGRAPNEVRILPGIFPLIAPTRAEAEDKFAQLQDLVDPVVGTAQASSLLGGADLSRFDLDGPLPPLDELTPVKSRSRLVSELAKSGRLTIRQLYLAVAGARGHFQVVGSAEDIADTLEEWFVAEAADGFNIMPPTHPASLTDFVDLVVPILQRRGLFRRRYEGDTLRAHLGLACPGLA